jgi:CRP/FNR family cyclic AMP-dependent transcriptional regulator
VFLYLEKFEINLVIMNQKPIQAGAADGKSADWRAVLGALPIFAGFLAADIDTLAGSAQARPMRRGEVLMRAGDPGSFMMIVLTGEVQVILNAVSGREQTINTLGPGAIIGEISLFDGKSRTANVVAVTNGRVLTIERAAMQRLIVADAQLGLRVIEMLCGRLRETMLQLESLLFQDVAARLAASLISLGQGKPKRLDITQSALGNLIGASREIVNKRLRQLEREGIVALSPGRVIVLDEVLLAKQVQCKQQEF